MGETAGDTVGVLLAVRRWRSGVISRGEVVPFVGRGDVGTIGALPDRRQDGNGELDLPSSCFDRVACR